MKYPKLVFQKGRFPRSDQKLISAKVRCFWDIATGFADAFDKTFHDDMHRIIDGVKVISITESPKKERDEYYFAHFHPKWSSRKRLAISLTPRKHLPSVLPDRVNPKEFNSHFFHFWSVVHELLHAFYFLDALEDPDSTSCEEFIVLFAEAGIVEGLLKMIPGGE